eukprot:TRINITY_DN1055_c0_g1_i2.p1 TRINITY_DN1055_c0_g1~~TRINITY_DN1055_c0_g1_i2.p1  ORF type:complete len:130 (-),score=18.91 TRINITY_DN1055_c0_g1_i2:81-470(-)
MNPVIPKTLRAVKSANLVDAELRAIRLYRQMLRAVPQILSDYKLHNVPYSTVRDRIKTEFIASKQANGDCIERIDRTIFRGAQELEETLMNWKTPTHVYRFIDVEKSKQQQQGSFGFLKKFYTNTLNPY